MGSSYPKYVSGMKGDDPLKDDLSEYPSTCPSHVDGQTFYEGGVDPQTAVVLPHLAAPMSPIDIYYSLEENKTRVPPPLFHPNAYKSQLHQRHLALYQDPLPAQNLEEHPVIKKLLTCRHCNFRDEIPLEAQKREWAPFQSAYPFKPHPYHLNRTRNVEEAIFLRSLQLSDRTTDETDGGM